MGSQQGALQGSSSESSSSDRSMRLSRVGLQLSPGSDSLPCGLSSWLPSSLIVTLLFSCPGLGGVQEGLLEVDHDVAVDLVPRAERKAAVAHVLDAGNLQKHVAPGDKPVPQG